ncbi:hypothetical protein [Microbispora sp. GKU 823]|uniref:hypothetical protein n=1 Tax=Microbispora sp. GKU 823 TaxID=1652100 RepID=UPI0026CF3608
MSSYRRVSRCSPGSSRRRAALSRTAPRQRRAHLPAGGIPAQRSRCSAERTPRNGLGNSASSLSMWGLTQVMQAGSASMSATTSRPSRMIWMSRASGNARSSTGAL